VWPQLRRLDPWHFYNYIGHRLLRWIGGYFLTIAILLLVTAVILVLGPVRVLAIGGSGLCLFGVALLGRLSPATMVLNAMIAVAGNVVGVFQALRGVRAITWEPPPSARSNKVPELPE
jgi:hypothetical protein